MKKSYVIGLLVLLLTGCGTGTPSSSTNSLALESASTQESGTNNESSANTGGGSGNESAVVKENIYVINNNNTIAMGQIESDGTVTSFTTTAVAGISGNAFYYSAFTVADPSGNFLYVPQEASTGITQYIINKSTNTVKANTPESVASGYGPNNLVFSKSGRCMFVGSDSNWSNQNVISSYMLNQQNGVLSPTGSAPAESSPIQLVITSDDKFAYVPNFGSSTVSMFKLDESSCVLTPITVNGTNNSNSINTYINPDNPTYSDGVAHGPWVATISPDNKHLYVSNLFAGNGVLAGIAQYNVNESTGALSFMESAIVTTSYSTGKLVFDQTGKYAYVPVYSYSSSNTAILMYKVGSDGGLTPISSTTPSIALNSTQGGNETFMDLDSSGKFFYVTVSNTISIYTIGSDGTLLKTGAMPLKNSDMANPKKITNIQFSANGQFLYVQNPWDNKIYAYSINRGNLNTMKPVLKPVGILPDTGGTPEMRGLLIANSFNQAMSAPFLWNWY